MPPDRRPTRLGVTLARCAGGVCVVLAATASCGGQAAATGNDGGRDGSTMDAPGPDVVDSPTGPTGCVSASGYAVCGGAHDCFPSPPAPDCQDCYSFGSDAAALCQNAALPHAPLPGIATDGQVYADGVGDGQWEPFPFEVGELFAGDGLGARVRYADWSSWTGAALPAPTSCPSFANFTICGGNCGRCPTGDICTGRSPGHPYGFCIPSQASGCDETQGWSCPSGQPCAVFSDSAPDQPLANKSGICMDSAGCMSLAGNYPGGAQCHSSGD